MTRIHSVSRLRPNKRVSRCTSAAASTWPSGVRPLCHHSSSAKIFEGKNVALNAHADYIYSKFNSCGLEVDVEIEAKAKELAVMKYVSLWADQHKEDGLQVLPLKSAA